MLQISWSVHSETLHSLSESANLSLGHTFATGAERNSRHLNTCGRITYVCIYIYISPYYKYRCTNIVQYNKRFSQPAAALETQFISVNFRWGSVQGLTARTLNDIQHRIPSVSEQTAKQQRLFVASVDFVDLECNLEEKAYASSCVIMLYHTSSGATNPPACRRALWTLLVRSCTVCLVFCLRLDFPLGVDFSLV